MVPLRKTVTIDAPPDRVFRFVNSPVNISRYCANMVSVAEIQEFPGCKTRFLWIYKLMGARFHGVAQTTHCQYGRFIEMETRGGIRSKIVWWFYPHGEAGQQTSLVFEMDYVVPKPLLGRFTSTAIRYQNDQDVDDMLERLAIVLEGREEAVTVPQ